ncbi:MAG: hypothetical protein V7745_01610 [Pseudomonadales bacterium]
MDEKQESAGLDGFTRNYLYILVGLVLVGFVLWLSSLDFRVSEVNELLEADAELTAYPYPFRVVSLENGVAQVSSPRSAKLSAVQSLRVMYPALQKRSAVSDEMMAAQEELARVQSYAGKLVKSQEDVSAVRWVLDQRWLANHGVRVD